MRPQDIQQRDFLVGLRGYDRDDVRSFLTEVAFEHAAVLAELEDATGAIAEAVAAAGAAKAAAVASRPVPEPVPDDFDGLGANVASILRAARESAAEVGAAAEARAAELDDEAAARLAAAGAALDDARAEAGRIIESAVLRARDIEATAEAEAARVIDDAARRTATIRARLLEASDEVQLALMALDDVAPASSPARPDEDDVPATVAECHDLVLGPGPVTP